MDPSIRGDCGATAGDTRGIVTKDGCLNAGCCWDTSHDGVPWCYYAEHSSDKNIAAEQNNGDIEIILEASPIKENVPNQSLFGQPNVLKNEPIQAPTHKIGHPTTSPLSSIFPSSNAPKRKQSALAKNMNEACKSDKIVSFMKEMGFKNPEKYGKIPCISDGKGALGTNRPAWGWSKKHKDTETNHQIFMSENPQIQEKASKDDVIISYRLKTCKQFSEKVTNETLRDSAMEKLNCSSVDFANYDPATDPIQQNQTALIPSDSSIFDKSGTGKLGSMQTKLMQSMAGGRGATTSMMNMMKGMTGGRGMSGMSGLGGMSSLMGKSGLGGMSSLMGGMGGMSSLMGKSGLGGMSSLMGGMGGMSSLMGGMGGMSSLMGNRGMSSLMGNRGMSSLMGGMGGMSSLMGGMGGMSSLSRGMGGMSGLGGLGGSKY